MLVDRVGQRKCRHLSSINNRRFALDSLGEKTSKSLLEVLCTRAEDARNHFIDGAAKEAEQQVDKCHADGDFKNR